MLSKKQYRLPLFHCLIACLASLILGFGLGYSFDKLFTKEKLSQSPPPPATATLTPSPSALPEPSPSQGKIIITVYFDNVLFNPNAENCSAVFPVKRQIPVTNVSLRAALDQLFLGPTEQEQTFGYRSLFSNATKNLIKSQSVKNGEVYLDFDRESALKAIEAGANSSCGHEQFLRSIKKTALEFTGITSVDPSHFTIEGSRPAYVNLFQQ